LGIDGGPVRESNARFVRWSDGSLQLLLGCEVLDVSGQDITSNNFYLFAHLSGLLQVGGWMTV
jgi:RNA polymerase-associated protein LEO1